MSLRYILPFSDSNFFYELCTFIITVYLRRLLLRTTFSMMDVQTSCVRIHKYIYIYLINPYETSNKHLLFYSLIIVKYTLN